MKSAPTIALCGLGGYGALYLGELIANPLQLDYRITAVIDPEPDRLSPAIRHQVPDLAVYADLEEFYRREKRPDLLIIASPIHLHCEQTLQALANGSDVLCEKPAAATPAEVRQMIAAEAQSDARVHVGFQWVYSDAVRRVNHDFRAGRLGRPLRLKAFNFWPRPTSYYHRNDWAGRLRTADGHWVLDSPANNAFAHDLHLLLYLGGVDTAAGSLRLKAETYRAHAIETHDSIALRIRTAEDSELLLFASHATDAKIGPLIEARYSRATLRWQHIKGDLNGRLHNGVIQNYGPVQSGEFAKLWQAIEARRTGTRTPICGLADAMIHTRCIDAIHRSQPKAAALPAELLQRRYSKGEEWLFAPQLREDLQRCFASNSLPSELGLSWAVPAKEVEL